MLTFDIRGIAIKCIEREVIPSGTIGAKIKFVFDDEWQSLNKTVTFDYEDQNRNIKHADLVVSGAEILIPPSVVASPGRFRLGIYGANGGSIATPTLYSTWFETPPGAVPSGITPEPPSTLVNQIYDIASSAESKAQSAVETSQRAVDIASETGEQAAAAASSASAAAQSASNSAASASSAASSASAALSNANAAASSAAGAEAARQQAQATADSLIFSNPNLLDNWYFGNPVNQRGQTSYTGGGYGIDRWYAYSGVLKIQNDIIELSGNSSGGTLEQRIENPKRFAGKTVTLSVLGNRLKASWYITVRQDGVYKNTNLMIPNDFSCASTTFVADSTLSNELTIVFSCWDESDVAEIKAIKLELGSQQTLAHQENGVWQLTEIPDYGEQLARCQRYFQLYSASDKRPEKAVDCRPVMRAEPSQGTIVIGSTTYYYNTAEL